MSLSAAVADWDQRSDYDQFLIESGGSILQSYDWGEFKGTYGWIPHRLIVTRDYQIVAAVTALEHSSRFLYSPRGPVVLSSEPRSTWEQLIASVRDLASQRGLRSWSCDPEVSDHRVATILNSLGFTPTLNGPFGGTQPQSVWRIPLTPDWQQQWQLLSDSARRQVKRARTAGLVCRRGGRELIPDLSLLIGLTARHHHINLRDAHYFTRMYELMAEAGTIDLFVVYLHSRPLAGAVVLHWGDTVWDLYAGTDRALDVGAGYFLTFQTICHFAARGYRVYDLGGVPERGNGLLSFKRRFGGWKERFIGEYRLEINHDGR